VGLKFKAVVFDLFGTLVPKWSSSLASETLSRISITLDVDHVAFARAWRQTDALRETGQMSIERGFKLAAEACNVANQQRVDEATNIWLELVRQRMAPREIVFDVLATCRDRGLRVGLLSDCNDDVPRIFRELSIAPMFDALGFSCELGTLKPAAHAYLEVCRRLGVEPQNCAYIGDGGSNELRGARQVGMTAVFLRHAREIELEGLPEGAGEWEGPAIENLDDLFDELGRWLAVGGGPKPA
jgi:putative hydrolase of the HAD superfamily